jgi:predicted DNA-binding transcriptional regulator YafY
MPANKSATIRYRIIDRCLRNPLHKYPSKEYIRQKISDQLFGEGSDSISLSSIEKDIVAMRDDESLGYRAPIKYSKLFKGYYYDDPDYSIDSVGLSEEDCEALRNAGNTLQLFAENALFADLRQAIEKINARFSLSGDMNDPNVERYVQFETPHSTNGLSWIKPIYDAIVKRAPIHFSYFNVYKNETKNYDLDPYLLKEVKNNWYVIGWNHKKERFSTFALDRITNLHSDKKLFKYRRDFNSDAFYKYSTGIMEGPKPSEKIILEIYGPIARLLEISPLHPSQRTITKKQEVLKVELEVSVNEEFMRLLLTYCNTLKVVKPASLRTKLKSELMKGLTFYR